MSRQQHQSALNDCITLLRVIYDRMSAREDVPSAPIPLLLIFGEKTDSPGIALKDRIAAAAPHRRVVVVPGATHFLPMEQPEETARLALQFLAAE